MPHLSFRAQKTKLKRTRRRAIPFVFSSNRLDELLWQLLDDGDPALRTYVYRLKSGAKITPAVFNGCPFAGLLDYLRDEHNGGDFHIIIRRGRQMELSGIICIGERIRTP